jgi:alpha-tubulin suppressor-like RCC1 family protein
MRKSPTASISTLRVALPFVLGLLGAALPALAQEDVSWIDTTGASAVGSTLTKIGPPGWNAGGRSSRSLVAGDGSLAFSVPEAATAKACGLTRGGFGHEEMDYGILLGADGSVTIMERAVATPFSGTYATGDLFEIALQSGSVTYRQNGALIHTSATVPQYPLTVAAALDTPGASVANVVLTGALAENVRWASAVNATAVGSDLVKSGGAPSVWDAGAVSTRGIVSGSGYVEIVASETSTNRMFGLSRGQTDQAYADIDFALYLAANRLYVYEAGVQRGSFGTFVPGDRLRVAVEGGVVKYLKGSQVLYTSAVAPTFPLLVDTSLYSLGATLQDAVISGELQAVAAAPLSFSVPTGHYPAAQSVVITASDPAAEIHFTTTGADPTQSDPVVASGESVLVDTELTLKARAWVPGLIPSSVTKASYTFGPTTAEQAVWTAAVNATAVGTALVKSAGASNTWDAGAVSTQGIASMDGYAELLASETNSNRMFGLSHGDTNQAYGDIDFALYLAGNHLYVYEAGVQRGAFGTFVPGDRLRVAVEGGVLKYRKNGALLYTSGVAPTFPLLVDTSFYSIGATLQDVAISGRLQTVAAAPPSFSVPTGHYPAAQSVVITASDPGAEIHFTTTGADPTQSDPVVVSGESVLVATDLTLKARVWAPGLIPSGVASATYTLGPTTLEDVVWTAAVNATAVGNDLTKSARVSNTWDAGAVSTRGIVSMDGYLEVTASETGTNRMFGLSYGQTNQAYGDIDFALYLAGSQLYVYEAGVQRGSFGTFVSGDRLRVAVEGGIVNYRKNNALLYTSGAAPTFPLLADTSFYSVGATLQDAVLSGELQVVAATPPSLSLPTGHYLTAQSVVIAAPDPGAEIHVSTSGADPTQSDPVVVSGESVLVETNLTLKARSWVAGMIPSSVTSALYTFGPTSLEDVVWTAAVNATAAGNDLTKSGGVSNTWDAGATSTMGIVSMDGYVEVTASETTTNRMFGLSYGQTNQAYGDIDFALYLAGNRLYIYEAGVQRGSFGTFVPGDRLRVAVEGGVIKYLKNGQLLHASGVVPTFPLLVDTSFYSAGATLQDAVLFGALQSMLVAAPVFTPPPGTYQSAEVTIASATPGAEIRYTLDSSDPNPTSTLYSVPIALSGPTTIKARAFKPGLLPSEVTTGTYGLQVATPTLNPVPGSYSSPQSITLGSATSGAAIRYSLDGTEPTEGSPLYVSPLQVATTTTILARAFKAGLDPSEVVSGTYAIAATAAVEAGAIHSLLLLPDRTVRAWGYNGEGQIGNGTTENKLGPVPVPGLSDVTAVSAGYHNLAIKSGGSLWVWGAGWSGQLGLGTTDSALTPVQVPGLTGVVAVSAGESHSLVLDSTGHVWGFGANYSGQLGLGTTDDGLTPVQIPGLTGIVAISAGGSHSLALDSGGHVWAFGANYSGQLGLGTTEDSLTPVQVPDLTGVVAISAGGSHSLALDSSGNVWAFGSNFAGQLGLGTTEDALTPVQIPGLAGVAAVSAGSAHSLALASAGHVWAFGSNWAGQLGLGTAEDGPAPVQVPGLTGVVMVSAGESHSLALTADGTVLAFGANDSGQIGDWSTTYRYVPTPLNEPGYVWKAAMPSFSPEPSRYESSQTVTVSVALPTATIHYTTNSAEPTEADPVIESGGTVLVEHSTTLKARAWAPGLAPSNVATGVYLLAPEAPTFDPPPGEYEAGVAVTLSTSTSGADIRYTLDRSDVTAASPLYTEPISVSASTLITARAFRAGLDPSEAALGEYTIPVASPAPTLSPPGGAFARWVDVTVTCPVPELIVRYRTDGALPTEADPQAVCGSAIHVDGTLAVTAIGVLPGSTHPSAVVTGQYWIVGAVAEGGSHRLVLRPSGELWAWGDGGEGQIGNGGNSAVEDPVQLSLPPLIAIAAGGRNSLAVTEAGQVYAWGASDEGQIGDGTTELKSVPIQVPGLSGALAVAAGEAHSLALLSDGRVMAWGANGRRELGGDVGDSSLVPVEVAGLSDVVRIAAGRRHSLALKRDGSIWSWGDNELSQAGSGWELVTQVPTQVLAPGSAVSIAAGDSYSLAITPQGEIRGWGDGTEGALGSEALGLVARAPVSVGRKVWVEGPEGPVEGFGPFGPVDAVSGGSLHSVAGMENGLYAWGPGSSWELLWGVDSEPMQLVTTARIVSLSSRGEENLGLDTQGVVYTWRHGPDGTTPAKAITDASGAFRVLPPRLSIEPGLYRQEQQVAVTETTPGSTLRYTLDGSLPDETSPEIPSGGTISITQTTSLYVVAFVTARTASEAVGGQYTLKVMDPVLSPSPGTYHEPVDITVSVSTTGATLHHSMSGPATESDPVVASGQSVQVTPPQTLWVAAFRDGWEPSQVQAAYALGAATPVLSPPGGTYAGPVTVTITTATPGATLEYWTDGRGPYGPGWSRGALLASGGTVRVERGMTLMARAVRDGLPDSTLVTATYRIALARPTLVTERIGGEGSALYVTGASGDSGAAVRCTTDGFEPTPGSSLCDRPIPIDRTTTVKAKAFLAGIEPSETVERTFTVTGAVPTPTLGLAGGAYPSRRTVSVTAPGAVVRYTTNGLDPTASDAEVPAEGVLVDHSLSLKVRAWVGTELSLVARADYLLTGAVTAGETVVTLGTTGNVWSWGRNDTGQTGTGSTTSPVTSPVQVAISDVLAIASGETHTLALKSDRSIWVWGSNLTGALGDPNRTVTLREQPTQVAGLPDMVGVAAGSEGSAGLDAQGGAWVWGGATSFMSPEQWAAAATPHESSPPVPCVRLFAAGSVLACADGAGRTWRSYAWSSGGVSWEQDTRMGFAVGDMEGPGDPLLVTGGGREGLVSCGWWSEGDPTRYDLAPAVEIGPDTLLTQRGMAWSVGSGDLCSVGSPTSVVAEASPALSVAESSVAHVNGDLWRWGPNNFAQLGLGNTDAQTYPTKVPGLSVVSEAWLQEDPDADGLANHEELRLGADPYNPDTNGDGVTDGASVAMGRNPLSVDLDGDGISNRDEIESGTNPLQADTDGDGHADGVDLYPLDPGRWEPEPPTPGDTDPPIILLTEPQGAVLVSSIP